MTTTAVAAPDGGVLPGDALRVLDLLERNAIDSPTDVTEEIGSINHRYARELLGLLSVQRLAELDQNHAEGQIWRITDAGRELAQANRSMVQLSQNANHRPQPKETKMASKRTKPVAKQSKRQPKGCGCGCGTQVMGTFAQGHDARMVSLEVGKVTTQAQADQAAGRIDKQFGSALAAKFANAAHRKLNKPEPKPRKRAVDAKDGGKTGKRVTAKVGRWEKQGHLTAEGDLVTTDAKGREQVIAKGKYTLVK